MTRREGLSECGAWKDGGYDRRTPYFVKHVLRLGFEAKIVGVKTDSGEPELRSEGVGLYQSGQ